MKEEICRQAQLDSSKAWLSYFFVGLDELVEEYKVIFPEYDWFLRTAEHEMMERLIVEFIEKKPRTVHDLALILKCEKKEVQQILDKLQEQGIISKKENSYFRKTSIRK